MRRCIACGNSLDGTYQQRRTCSHACRQAVYHARKKGVELTGDDPAGVYVDSEWRDRAACLGMDHEVFFPIQGEAGLEAKAICATCPVIDECLEWAIELGIDTGVYGGTNARERYRIKRSRIERRSRDRRAS